MSIGDDAPKFRAADTMPPVSKLNSRSANRASAAIACRSCTAYSWADFVRASVSWMRITVSCCPAFTVYAADQSVFSPISETIIFRSCVRDLLLQELLDVRDPPLGGVEAEVRRRPDWHRDLPGVHLREELLADARDEEAATR